MCSQRSHLQVCIPDHKTSFGNQGLAAHGGIPDGGDPGPTHTPAHARPVGFVCPMSFGSRGKTITGKLIKLLKILEKITENIQKFIKTQTYSEK
jgi:hypothetical protein